MDAKSVSPARLCALKALRMICAPHGPAVQAALDGILRKSALSPADRRLATELTYGVLRQGSYLDVVIEGFLRRPSRTTEELRHLLRMAAFELLFCERIPPFATVDAATELAGIRSGTKAKGFVNGVLRALSRAIEMDRDAFDMGRLCGTVGYAKATGVPEWIIGLWDSAYGTSVMQAFVSASRLTPWMTYRVNAAKEGAAALLERLGGTPFAERVGAWGIAFPPGASPPDASRMVDEGSLSVQGAGSLRILEALGLRDVEGPVWDACCGRGGKSFALLEQGVPVSVMSDVSERRLSAVGREAARLGLYCPAVIRASAERPPFGAAFSPRLVLVDAPCSGLGTLSRHPDIRLVRRREDLVPLAALQRRILDAVWGVLPHGGRLAYVTCTVNPDENEAQIARILAEHAGARLLVEVHPEAGPHGEDAMYGALIAKP